MLAEALAAALVGLAVVALILGPLLRPGQPVAPDVDTPDDPEDTPRGMALAALREIEFDRATGKLSDLDYESLKAKYGAAAVALLRAQAAEQAAAGPGSSPTEGSPPAELSAETAPAASADANATDPVERLIADRVRNLSEGTARCPDCGPRPETDALFCSRCGRTLPLSGCAQCGAPLLHSSRYCESCGAAVAALKPVSSARR